MKPSSHAVWEWSIARTPFHLQILWSFSSYIVKSILIVQFHVTFLLHFKLLPRIYVEKASILHFELHWNEQFVEEINKSGAWLFGFSHAPCILPFVRMTQIKSNYFQIRMDKMIRRMWVMSVSEMRPWISVFKHTSLSYSEDLEIMKMHVWCHDMICDIHL